MIRCIEKLKLCDGVGGRALDSSWMGTFNEEREEDLFTPSQEEALAAQAAARTKERLCWRDMPLMGEREGQLEGSTMDKATDAAERAEIAHLGLQPGKACLQAGSSASIEVSGFQESSRHPN